MNIFNTFLIITWRNLLINIFDELTKHTDARLKPDKFRARTSLKRAIVLYVVFKLNSYIHACITDLWWNDLISIHNFYNESDFLWNHHYAGRRLGQLYIAVSINTPSSCTKFISAIIAILNRIYQDDADQLCSMLINLLVFEPNQFSPSSSGKYRLIIS